MHELKDEVNISDADWYIEQINDTCKQALTYWKTGSKYSGDTIAIARNVLCVILPVVKLALKSV